MYLTKAVHIITLIRLIPKAVHIITLIRLIPKVSDDNLRLEGAISGTKKLVKKNRSMGRDHFRSYVRYT